MEPEYEVFLPCWWIAKQRPSKPYRLPKNIPIPYTKYPKEIADQFCIEYDTEILDYTVALVVGSLIITESNDNLLDTVPNKFNKSTYIRSKKAAKRLLGHHPYDHAIDLKEGENPLWAPWYPLSSTELVVSKSG
jgi:hypothetical protein